jgi:hypothetical protein
MKKYEFEITPSVMHLFFPRVLVKTKLQIITILMEASRYMLSQPKLGKKDVDNRLVLYVDNMSRLFFFKDKKYYSIVFPFFVTEEEGELKFEFTDNIEINSYIISRSITAINSDPLNSDCSMEFSETILEFEDEFDGFWTLFKDLLVIEYGYIRYDKDIDGYEEAIRKGKPHVHPLNHYDLCYSNKATFKIGLNREVLRTEFIDLLNTKTDCKYLQN